MTPSLRKDLAPQEDHWPGGLTRSHLDLADNRSKELDGHVSGDPAHLLRERPLLELNDGEVHLVGP